MGKHTLGKPKPYDYVGGIIAWEGGDLDGEGTVTFFQYLIDTGLAWQLQGVYGRTAQRMIDAGECVPADEPGVRAYELGR